MTTLTQVIRRGKDRPIRRLFIKRRLTVDDSYEADWVRIDRFKNSNRVINWGSSEISIDYQSGIIANFAISSLGLLVENSLGLFNVGSSSESIWNPETTYLTRKLTKLKVETGYLGIDGTEINVTSIYEGLIDKIKINEESTAFITVISYQNHLSKFDISDLSLAGNQTVTAIVTAIMNQAKITKVIPFTTPVPDQNVTVDTTTLSGDYWSVIKRLAFISNSIPLMNGEVFNFKARSPGSVVFNFLGAGTGGADDIYKITAYDDEGADRVRLNWLDSDSGQSVISVDATLLSKYLGEPQTVNLLEITTGAEQLNALNALLSQWENPKPPITFRTRYMVNIVNPLDKITIKTFGAIVPANTARYGASLYGDGSVYGKTLGGINISSTVEWMVTRVLNDNENWLTAITAEKL